MTRIAAEELDHDIVRRLPEQKKVLRAGGRSKGAGSYDAPMGAYQAPAPLGEQWRTGVTPRVAVPAGAPRSIDDLPKEFRKPLAPPGRRVP